MPSGPFDNPGPIFGVAVNSATGELVVGSITGHNGEEVVDRTWEFSQTGRFLSGGFYFGEPVSAGPEFRSAEFFKVTAAGNLLIRMPFGIDPTNQEIYGDTGSAIEHFGVAENPLDTFGAEDLSHPQGLAVSASHNVYVANTGADDVVVFADVAPRVTTGPATEVTGTGFTVTGSIDPEASLEGHTPVTECYFEWGLDKNYGHTIPCEPSPEAPAGSPFTSATNVKAAISGLTPIAELPLGTTYHYRLVASNEKRRKGATAEGQDETAPPPPPPDRRCLLLPPHRHLRHSTRPSSHGLTTQIPLPIRHYHSLRPDHGRSVIEGSAKELSEPRKTPSLENLQPGATYHFRLVAESSEGTVTSEDQTFEFFPPACPNSAVRQQTGSAYLPDCRAYELVSPANADGTLLFPGGPNTGQATSPSRFSFTGDFGAIPGATPSTPPATSTSPPAPTPAGSPTTSAFPATKPAAWAAPPTIPAPPSPSTTPPNSRTPSSPTLP